MSLSYRHKYCTVIRKKFGWYLIYKYQRDDLFILTHLIDKLAQRSTSL